MNAAKLVGSGTRDARAGAETHDQALAELEGRAQAASDRAEELKRSIDEAAGDRTRLVSENAALTNQVNALREELDESQDFGRRLKTFLSGLGIRLPS